MEDSENIVGIKDGKCPKILVADDTGSNRIVAKALLEPVGFICIEAENGKQAIEKTGAEKPDLILMDLRMPIMGGLEALQQLRAKKEFSSIPVVALTASSFNQTKEELLAQGFDDLVVKPFAIEDLYDTIARLLEIEYIYDSAEPEQNENISGSNGQLSAENIFSVVQHINPVHYTQLRDAIETQDFDKVKKIISDLRQNSPDEAVGLSPIYNAAVTADYKFFSDLSSKLGS